ncbi:protein cordon-bleu isoform X2 [Thalassophryne amazonica]|uniref:protein cordon-bleu isoform X2 n=1 Tax=Thalassophryne amazonica TaxID=390379 RepID=UPI0014723D61|nr:protein cordon-bleu isoform X2 [Thalassophryne amazonica]
MSSKPPAEQRMKARAPPPPQVPQPAPRHIFRNTVPDGGGMSGVDAKETVLRPTVDLHLTLPQGYQISLTEDGSKALLDLLVELCSRYHLNPALHTLELFSPNGHPLGFKPNTLLGSLEVARVLIKEKVLEEKVLRRPAPKVPEKSVRLMVNYHGSQKAVIRVNPAEPLQALIPVICDKCELDPAHILLLKDVTSCHELPLDKSLTQLRLKELYVHDQTLALRPKMASAPALNYSDSLRSSTSSLGRGEKKGLMGIFHFRTSKSKGPSSVLAVPCIESQSSALVQSQSVMDMSRMSPGTESKKRRAPAPPGAPMPTTASMKDHPMGSGSEIQQRKRKAPAPPSTPGSITPCPDNASASAAAIVEIHSVETTTTAFHSKAAQSTTVPSTATLTEPASLEASVQPPTVTCNSSSPSSSSMTRISHVIQDSSSELSHSVSDSDTDLDQVGPDCRTSSSSTFNESTSAQALPPVKSSTPKIRMEDSMQASNMAAKLEQDGSSRSSSKSATKSALNLKLDKVENNRNSTIEMTDQPAPPKPDQVPAREPPLGVVPKTPSSAPPSYSSQGLADVEEGASQSHLHSTQTFLSRGQTADTNTVEEETLSLGSSSGNSSMPDQGYAASEGMAEGEDSGLVSSPCDTQPTSPDGSLSLDGSSGGVGEVGALGAVRDNCSDSDEGCATWESRSRHNGSPQVKSGKMMNSYKEDKELRAQIHKTLAEFDADLEGISHTDTDLAKKTPYTLSTDSNEVPVSVVDMDVPVTAIDEVLEDYEEIISKTRTELRSSKDPDFCQQFKSQLHNKNNNACTATESNKRSSENTKLISHTEQRENSQESKSESAKVEEKTHAKKLEAKTKTSVTDTGIAKVKKQRVFSSVKSDVDAEKHSKSSQLRTVPVKINALSVKEQKPVLAPTDQQLISTERNEEICRQHHNNTSTNASQGKITYNFKSRFGMKTFTVVPPKPSVMHTPLNEPTVRLTPGAIKIDEQGNMVKVNTFRNKFRGSSEPEINGHEGSPLLGKAKAFWSLNERQESAVPHSRGFTDKVKESASNLRNTQSAVSEPSLRSKNTEELKTPPSTFHKPAAEFHYEEMDHLKQGVNSLSEFTAEETVQVDNKISVSRNLQPSKKPALPSAVLPDQKRDLSFLKPSRKTSSQYVASAVTKYTPKISAKPNTVPESSSSLKTQSLNSQKSGQSIHVTPYQSSQSSLSGPKDYPAGPKRLMHFPEYMFDQQVREDSGRIGYYDGSTRGSFNRLEIEPMKNVHSLCGRPTQIKVATSGDRDNIKHNQTGIQSPAQSTPAESSAKLLSTLKTQDQKHTTSNTTRATTILKPDKEPEPSVTTPDTVVTLFGPVKKFKPVICRSVEKETSLHSSLMEAIQVGGGKERLKKIKSEAADELERCRKASPEKERNTHRASSPPHPPLSCTSPPPCAPTVSTPPTCTPKPPLPPPVLPQDKPSTVAYRTANAHMSPTLAREAMLEAIRSGCAADRLKKVAAPTKTVQVNGRLGTIQATSSIYKSQITSKE